MWCMYLVDSFDFLIDVMVRPSISWSISLLQVFSPFSPAMLLGPGYVMDSLAFAAPADAAFLSLQFDGEKQARVNAVIHLFSNLSTSISIALFSSPMLFQPEARQSAAIRPFLVTFVLVTIGGFMIVLNCLQIFMILE